MQCGLCFAITMWQYMEIELSFPSYEHIQVMRLCNHHAVNTEEKSCYTEPSIDGGSHCGLATPANSVLNPSVWGGEGERES